MAEIKLREIPLFSEMDDQEIAGIRNLMEEVRFRPNEVIIREGEIGDFFYIITEGSAEVIIRDAQDSEVIVHRSGPGEFFGELSMLTNEPRSARVRAISHVTTLALGRPEFFDFLRLHSNAAIDVLVELGRRLHTNNRTFHTMVSRNVNEVVDEQLTFGQRLADKAADIIGSWPFIITQVALVVTWFILNGTGVIKPWDPYPFILMSVILSFQGAFSGPVIMMSQNRQSAKDRLVAEVDHQVNTKAELEISNMIRRMDELELSIKQSQSEMRSLLTNLHKRETRVEFQELKIS